MQKKVILLIMTVILFTVVQVSAQYPESVKVIRIGPDHELQFQLIPAGTFNMGSPENEDKRDPDEGPVHQVSISQSYYLCIHEVTQSLWTDIMDENPSTFQRLPDAEQCPVETVTWNACQEFLRRLSEHTEGLFRLPTEAEWEYACRAGTETRFYWGEDPEEWIINQFAWANSRSFARPHPVGMKKPNAWGLYDMSGNVWEWCSDWYAAYPDRDRIDPTGPEAGKNKVFRGGSWYDIPQSHRSANRHRHAVDKGYPAIGLRLIWEEDQK